MNKNHEYEHDISKGVASCVQLCFEHYKIVMEDAKAYFESLVPELKSDQVFQDIFPIVFNMELCKKKLYTSS